jgi:hypothetical protein
MSSSTPAAPSPPRTEQDGHTEHGDYTENPDTDQDAVDSETEAETTGLVFHTLVLHVYLIQSADPWYLPHIDPPKPGMVAM